MRWFRRKTDKRSESATPVYDKPEHAPVGAAAYVAQRHAESGATPPAHAAVSASPPLVPTPRGEDPAPISASGALPQSAAPPEDESPGAAHRDAAPPALMTPDQLALVPSHARDGLVTEMDPKRRAIVDVLRSIYDPEIPVNIYDIGLIYDIQMQPEGKVGITMTLTSPMCPVAETLPPEVQNKVAGVDGVSDVDIDLVWEPGWTPVMMSEDAKLLLNIM